PSNGASPSCPSWRPRTPRRQRQASGQSRRWRFSSACNSSCVGFPDLYAPVRASVWLLSRLELMDAIVAEDLRKRYKTVQALDGVSFAVREGEVFGLLGPNGAGKSTTVRVLTTLTQPDSGRAIVAGEDVAAHPDRVRDKIGYVAQDSG